MAVAREWQALEKSQEPKMGAVWSLKLLPMRIYTIPRTRTATPPRQELSRIRILQRLGQNGLPRGLNLTPSENCLLQCQKYRSCGCILPSSKASVWGHDDDQKTAILALSVWLLTY